MSQILERVSEKVHQVVSVQNLELFISSPKQKKDGGKNNIIVRAGERISGIVRLAKSADIGKHEPSILLKGVERGFTGFRDQNLTELAFLTEKHQVSTSQPFVKSGTEYIWEFSFVIPSKIPPSIYIEEDEIEFASTKYEIMAIVELQNIIHSSLRSPPLEIIVLQSSKIEKPSIELKFETSEESTSGTSFEISGKLRDQMLSINGPVLMEGSLIRKLESNQLKELEIDLNIQVVQLLNIHNKDFKLNRVKIFPVLNKKLNLSHEKESFAIEFKIPKTNGLLQSVDCKLFSISHTLELQISKGDLNLKLPVVLNDYM